MAINNPLIPGDPYSYDLKWLVAKVKEILAQLGKLDEAIEAKIFEGFLEHSIVQFKTVPEMLAADIKDGSIVLTLGYHEAGDQGGTFYLVKDFNPAQCALDYFLTLDNNKQIAIPVIVTPYVTPEMFGAYGSGTQDDAEALQQAANHAHDHNSIVKLTKSYMTTKPIVIYGGENNTLPGTTLEGLNKGAAKIIAGAEMETVLQVTADGEACANVFISSIQIDCANLAGSGILLKDDTANCEFYDIKINRAASVGFTTGGDFYLSSIRKVRVDNSPAGFIIAAGINTSLNIVDCYVQAAENAYQIAAIYSLLQNCCADSITGTVFNLEHFTGSLISCGSEASGAAVMFHGGVGTDVDVIGAMTFQLTGEDAVQIDCGPGSRWHFHGGRLSHTESGSTAPGKMYQLALSARLDFDNTVLGSVAKTNDYSNITARVNFGDEYGKVFTRYDARLAFIGRDGINDEGEIDPSDVSNTTTANAIYMGLDDRQHKADGTDLQWTAATRQGDILLTQDPVKNAGAGWIQCQDLSGVSGARWISGTYKRIPIVLSGPKADRPTPLYNEDAGLMYLDTTLIKPIWWTGTRWIDATGTTV